MAPAQSRASMPPRRVQVDDATRERYCTHCKAVLAIDAFRKASKNQVCRFHETELYRKGFKARLTPEQRLTYKALHRVAVDAQRCFHTKPALTTVAIAAMALTPEQKLVPRHPDRPITPDNCFIVDALTRTLLMRAWCVSHDPAAYAALADKLGLSRPAEPAQAAVVENETHQ